MTTLLVTPFAPYRDGIAAYAIQELRRLRAEGEHVEVLSPLPSAARWHLPLGGPKAMAKLAAKAAAYDRTVLQFGPEMLFGGCSTAARRVAVWAGLAGLATRTSLDIRIHEIEYGPLEQNPLERRAARLAFERADRVTVHTEAEREALDRLIGLGRRVDVVDHGRDFVPTVDRTMEQARAELGLPLDQFAFVSIGFLQEHKGFDLAVDAVAQLSDPSAHLHVVGSARVDHPDITTYVERLADRCRQLANATLHERFVSDVEFDLWLQAADVVVLPYREIWSSGVVERARLFGAQLVASDLPQLRDQAPDGTIFFSDPGELPIIMEKLRAASERHLPDAGHRPDDDGAPAITPTITPTAARGWDVDRQAPDQGSIQAQIVARARAAQLSAASGRPASIDLTAATERSGGGRSGGRAVDPLLALGHLHRPQPTSARPGVAPVKRVIDRLIGWQIDPLARRLDELQRSTIEAVDRLDRNRQTGGAEDGTARDNQQQETP